MPRSWRTATKATRSTSRSFRCRCGTASDGGPYIGSGSIVVMRDPDTGWINASIYRVQVHGKNQVTVQFDHPGRHGAIIAKKYWDQGKPCPIVVVNGEDPALFIAGFESLPSGYSEFDFAGAIKEAPVELCLGPKTGLPIPAHAEIILEGVFKPATGETLMEGPFGEFTGYYASERRPLPIMQVEADPLSQRSDPARLAAAQAAAPSLRPAVSRRRDLVEPRQQRHHRRRRRVAARLVADDGRLAQAAIRWACQARRPGRSRQRLYGAHRRGRRRGHRSVEHQRRDVGDRDALRAVGNGRHHPERMELDARSAHPALRTRNGASPRIRR